MRSLAAWTFGAALVIVLLGFAPRVVVVFTGCVALALAVLTGFGMLVGRRLRMMQPGAENARERCQERAARERIYGRRS